MVDKQQRQNLNEVDLNQSQLQQIQGGDVIALQNSRLTIYKSFISLFGNRPVESSVNWDWATRIVLPRQQSEIEERLLNVRIEKNLLWEEQLISIKPEERLDLVGRSLSSIRQLNVGQTIETLDADRMLIEVFGRKDIGGKLLILGRPGAGKTTTLLGLAQQLVSGALENPQTVIPVIFELSAWKDDRQSIQDFLIEQLYDNVGGNRKSRIYETWLEQRVLLPLFDGLDELGMERQRNCTVKLNEFAATYPQVVVCCRVREFENVGVDLDRLNGAIVLQPLSDQQIQSYLGTVNRSGLWAQIVNTPEMARMLEPDEENEPGLLRVPLFISIAAAIYDEEQAFRSKGELLEKYIDRQLSSGVRKNDRRQKKSKNHQWAFKTVKDEPDYSQSYPYLTSLAQLLEKTQRVELIIDRMQPYDIDNNKIRWKYLILLYVGSLTVCIISVVYFILIVQIILKYEIFILWTNITLYIIMLIAILLAIPLATGSKSNANDIFDFICCYVFRKIFRLKESKYWRDKNIPVPHEIVLSNRFRITFPSFSKIKTEVSESISLLNQLAKLNFSILSHIKLMPLSLLFLPFTLMMTCIPIGTFILKIPGWFIDKKIGYENSPNEGLKESFKFFLFWFILVFISLLIFPVILYSLDLSIHSRTATVIISFIGLTSLLLNSSKFIQHICLRIVLTQDKKIPWNYARFLNYCHERRLLQRIGGRYRFIHREVRDHFGKDER
jgi:hypothetical protein